ncbi:hypothetical protein ACJIZ3_019155 [Penstemon smallii]|uniref:BHLH domain-containing protein n=1 Tax=Penstemon smallii TaxID=265156 RepID=A0ABD3T1M1_9LAMI
MSSSQGQVTEMEEYFDDDDDEMFGLKPPIIVPEISYSPQPLIFSNNTKLHPQISDHAKLISFHKNSKNIPNIINSDIHEPLSYSTDDHNQNSPQIINFSSNFNEEDLISTISNKRSSISTVNRTPLQARDHLMAERKRRQKLGQLFINLSKLVPGLKKLDKASLLEDAIDYVKALQERVNALEEEDKVMQINASKDDDVNDIVISEIISTTSDHDEVVVEEIKVRVMKKNVLIKICCKKQKGLMSKIPCEMEKMNLNVKDMRVMPFGGAAFDVTILAEMHNEFNCTVKDIVDHLEMVFLSTSDN